VAELLRRDGRIGIVQRSSRAWTTDIRKARVEVGETHTHLHACLEGTGLPQLLSPMKVLYCGLSDRFRGDF
jgi:hypothetical protein